MSTELSVHAVHEGDMRIVASGAEHTLRMDYPLQPGDKMTGLRPLEVLLASLAGCSGNALALLLRRLRQPVQGLEVNVRGTRRDEHPTVFTAITLEIVLHGKGIDSAVVTRAMAQAEERICPVWIMLKAGTPITSSFRIIEE